MDFFGGERGIRPAAKPPPARGTKNHAQDGFSRLRRAIPFESLPLLLQSIKRPARGRFLLWRRERDSNPRYPYEVYTISSRAPSTSSAISPGGRGVGDRPGNFDIIQYFREVCKGLFAFYGRAEGVFCPITKPPAYAGSLALKRHTCKWPFKRDALKGMGRRECGWFGPGAPKGPKGRG